ncbi:predicted protein [Methanosarcina acetivorans C2A]|uniref:Uncharacterized protein n=1 Tax=Methanosarcina acetivorans (strain ATCC 35395 / DSM 2834 / JCM 12185 / C2A) TaxID=188937 RepID=Q8TLU5_METAC|nr:predicted protein [Methanosarcina acetivorans C2A]
MGGENMDKRKKVSKRNYFRTKHRFRAFDSFNGTAPQIQDIPTDDKFICVCFHQLKKLFYFRAVCIFVTDVKIGCTVDFHLNSPLI